MPEIVYREPRPPIIQLDDISRTCQMGSHEVKALRKINLEIVGEEFIIILEPSGSGKTTMLNPICDIDSPTSVKLVMDGNVTNL